MKPSASSETASGRAGPALLVAQTSFLGDVVLTTPLLAELRTSPINGKAPRGVLLIFYRGYW